MKFKKQEKKFVIREDSTRRRIGFRLSRCGQDLGSLAGSRTLPQPPGRLAHDRNLPGPSSQLEVRRPRRRRVSGRTLETGKNSDSDDLDDSITRRPKRGRDKRIKRSRLGNMLNFLNPLTISRVIGEITVKLCCLCRPRMCCRGSVDSDREPRAVRSLSTDESVFTFSGNAQFNAGRRRPFAVKAHSVDLSRDKLGEPLCRWQEQPRQRQQSADSGRHRNLSSTLDDHHDLIFGHRVFQCEIHGDPGLVRDDISECSSLDDVFYDEIPAQERTAESSDSFKMELPEKLQQLNLRDPPPPAAAASITTETLGYAMGGSSDRETAELNATNPPISDQGMETMPRMDRSVSKEAVNPETGTVKPLTMAEIDRFIEDKLEEINQNILTAETFVSPQTSKPEGAAATLPSETKQFAEFHRKQFAKMKKLEETANPGISSYYSLSLDSCGEHSFASQEFVNPISVSTPHVDTGRFDIAEPTQRRRLEEFPRAQSQMTHNIAGRSRGLSPGRVPQWRHSQMSLDTYPRNPFAQQRRQSRTESPLIIVIGEGKADLTMPTNWYSQNLTTRQSYRPNTLRSRSEEKKKNEMQFSYTCSAIDHGTLSRRKVKRSQEFVNPISVSTPYVDSGRFEIPEPTQRRRLEEFPGAQSQMTHNIASSSRGLSPGRRPQWRHSQMSLDTYPRNPFAQQRRQSRTESPLIIVLGEGKADLTMPTSWYSQNLTTRQSYRPNTVRSRSEEKKKNEMQFSYTYSAIDHGTLSRRKVKRRRKHVRSLPQLYFSDSSTPSPNIEENWRRDLIRGGIYEMMRKRAKDDSDDSYSNSTLL